MVVPREVSMGTAVVDTATCYKALGQPCDYGVVRCPIKPDAITFVVNGLPVIHAKECAGCGACSYLCPADAIRIDPLVAM